MAGISLGAALVTTAAIAAASAAASAGTQAYTQHQTNKANKSARREQLAAEERQAKQAKAATAGQARSRSGYGQNTNASLRGIQATMLASRRAQNDGAAGKSTLGE